MYPGKTAGDHRSAAQQARAQRGMLTAAAFAVIAVADGHPFDPLSLVVAGNLGDWLVLLAAQYVDAFASLVVEGVDRAHEHVVAEPVEMAAEAQPIPGRRDVVGRGLALGLDQHRHVEEILAVPGGPGLHDLKPLAARVDLDFDAAAVLGRADVSGVAVIEVARRHLGRRLRRVEAERLAVAAGQAVGQRVERQPPAESHRSDDLGATDEVHRRCLAVVPRREVAVVGGHDRVGLLGLLGRAAPLPDARAAGIGQHSAADVLQ